MNPTPLNYSNQAIEDFQRMVEIDFNSDNDPLIYAERKHNLDYMADYFTLLTELLNSAIKFTLPDNGRLIDSSEVVANITSKQLELLMLPFPIIALEYSAPNLNDRVASGNFSAEKRISLALDFDKINQKYKDEMQRLMPSINTNWCSEKIAVFSVFHTQDDGWLSSLGCTFINSESDFKIITLEDKEKYTRVSSQPAPLFVLSPDPNDYAKLASDVCNDIADEAIVLVEFCAIINCNNVETQIIKASEKLNKKRITSGKLPLYDYHVLVLSRSDGKSVDSHHQGGSHASPRMHLRRGHIRRLSDTRVTWVNASVIGNKNDGVVEKSYSLNSTS